MSDKWLKLYDEHGDAVRILLSDLLGDGTEFGVSISGNVAAITGALPAGTNNIGKVDEAAIACSATDTSTVGANTAAVITYGSVAAVKHVITGIVWSYTGGIPVGGNLKVEDVSGVTVFNMDIDESGPGIIVFPKPKKSAAVGTTMIITLAAGGAGVTGKVSVLNHWTEA